MVYVIYVLNILQLCINISKHIMTAITNGNVSYVLFTWYANQLCILLHLF